MHDLAQMNVEDYLQIVYRRIWWILVPAALFMIGGVILARFLPKYYVANTLVLVEGQKVPSNYVESTVTSEVERRLQTIQEEVMSRSRLYEIIERFNLFPESREELSTDQLISRMRKNINIEIKHRDAFAIYYVGRDPKLVAQVANALTQQFINANLKIREEQARETANFMGEMLREQQEVLKKQEATLAAFLKAHPGELPEHTTRNIRLIEQLNIQIAAKQVELKNAEETRIMLEQQITALEDLPPTAIEGNATKKMLLERLTALEGQLSLLKVSHTELHPQIKAKKQEIENLKTLITQLSGRDQEREAATKIVDVSKIGSQEEKAALINDLQRQLDEIASEIDALQEEQAQLQIQLETREDLLKRQEVAWAEFLTKHPDVLPEPMDRNVRMIEQLNLQIISKQNELRQLNQKRGTLEENMVALKSRQSSSSKLPGFSRQKLNDLKRELTLLKANYTETHPEVQAKIKEIENLERADHKEDSPTARASDARKDIADTIQQTKLKELRQELTRVTETINFIKSDQIRLQKKIDDYQQKVENAPNLEVQLKELTRKYEQERKQYEELLAKNLDAELARKLELRQKGEQFIQIDEAVPPQAPFKPDVKKVLTLSTFLGLGLGLGLAFTREYFDRTFINAKDLEKSTGVPVLGSIPYVAELGGSRALKIPGVRRRIRSRKRPIISINDGGYSLDRILPASVQEFYRVLKVKLEQQFDKKDTAITCIITSTAPQEGKTTTAINLAWIMTKGLNKKAVLVECDFYRPKVASYLGLDSNAGLSDYLHGNAKLEDVLIPIGESKFFVIPAGSVSETASEALESKTMRDLLDSLRSDFDYIVIDTPSVMATIYESNTLTPLVDGILFVVRAEESPRDHVIHALTLVNKDKLLGTVLNCGAIAKRASYERYTEYRIPDTASSRIPAKRENKKSIAESESPKASKKKNEQPLVEANAGQIKNEQPNKTKEKGAASVGISASNTNTRPLNNRAAKSIVFDNRSPDIHNTSRNADPKDDKKQAKDNDVSLKSRIREYLSGNNGNGFANNGGSNNIGNNNTSRHKANAPSRGSSRKKKKTVTTQPNANKIAAVPDNSRADTSNQKTYIRMILDDKDGTPYADKDYKITIDGKVYVGKTNADGLVDQEIPADAKSGELTLRPNERDPSEVLVWPLHIDNPNA